MRALLLALIGCSGGSGNCELDSDCRNGTVCARDGECLPASEVRPIKVTWTIRGVAPNPTLCARAPDLYVLFASTVENDTYGYEPVPCQSGLFTVDKLPRRYISVELGADGVVREAKPFDSQGNAAFDLVF